jgi:hypothetical protein
MTNTVEQIKEALEEAIHVIETLKPGHYGNGTLVRLNDALAALRESAHAPQPQISDEFISALILRICELPDRTSPEDDPEAMICSAEELRNAIRVTEEEFDHSAAPCSADAKDAIELLEIAARNAIEHVGSANYTHRIAEAHSMIDAAMQPKQRSCETPVEPT